MKDTVFRSALCLSTSATGFPVAITSRTPFGLPPTHYTSQATRAGTPVTRPSLVGAAPRLPLPFSLTKILSPFPPTQIDRIYQASSNHACYPFMPLFTPPPPLYDEHLQTCRPYILPERYSVPFTEAAEEEEARPKAILFLKFVGAKDVPKMDHFSQSDPYVR